MEAKPRVLVVDDDLPILTLMTRVLAEFDFVPSIASTGAEAVELARRNPPDVVLLDWNMPDVGGEELILLLRQEPALASAPIVVLSGERLDDDRLRQAGATSAVLKPFDLLELVDLLRTTAAEQRA